MILFYTKDIAENRAILHDQEAVHCGRVLRKKNGDRVNVTDGLGNLYSGIVSNVLKSEVEIDLGDKIKCQEIPTRKGIAICPTKQNARIEWFIEKAVEIGITDIHFILAKRSEKTRLKMERLESIALAAMKQSLHLHLPRLHTLEKMDVFLNNCDYQARYIAHCMDPQSHLVKINDGESSAVVLIGPEGDFTEDEVVLANQNNFREVSLGNSRLRTETAGIVAAHCLNLVTV